MGYGNFVIDSLSPRGCFSTEEFNERQNYQPITTEEKIILDLFYLPYRDVSKEYREYRNNVFHINQLITFLYHVLFAKMYILIIIVVMNIILHVHLSVM